MEISRVHMISLAAEPERRAHAQAVLASLPWPGTLHDACDCRTEAGFEATARQVAIGSEEDVPIGYRPKWRGPMTPAEVGCMASHVAVWQAIAAAADGGQEQMHIVLEDDVMVPDPATLAAFFAGLGTAWDPLPELLYLGYERFELAARPRLWPVVAALGNWAMTVGQTLPSLRHDIRHHLLARRYPRPATAAVAEPNRTLARQHHLLETGLHDGAWAYALSTTGAHKLARLALPICLRSDELMNVAVATGVLTAFTPPRKLAIPRSDVASTLFRDRDFRSYTP